MSDLMLAPAVAAARGAAGGGAVGVVEAQAAEAARVLVGLGADLVGLRRVLRLAARGHEHSQHQAQARCGLASDVGVVLSCAAMANRFRSLRRFRTPPLARPLRGAPMGSRARVLAAATAAVLLAGSVSVSPAVAQDGAGLCDSGDTAQFDDVGDSYYGAAYILCMKALGLSKGKSSGEFGANDKLTRAQMASFLVRLWRDALGEECPAGSAPFSDVPAGSAHGANIDCVYALGITRGATATTYAPQATLTTSQISRFVYRLHDRLGRTCAKEDPGAPELVAAAACLIELRIAPNDAEATSDRPATRAQTAVYQIGLWHNHDRGTKPPLPPIRPNTFQAVTAGSRHSCGLRSEDIITCWGYNSDGQADAPRGAFQAVTAGSRHSCGLRSEGTITCWGNNSDGQADAPRGAFQAVTAGYDHSCGLRAEDTITCWGNNYYGETDAPRGKFQAVTAGSQHSCGLRADNTIACWGNNSGAPRGAFQAVTAGYDHSCGLRAEGTITCWGNNSDGQTDAPRGAFQAVTAGYDHSCGLRADNTITCWGNNSDGQTDAPRGKFQAVTASGGFYGSHSCGLRTDNTITCWGQSIGDYG